MRIGVLLPSEQQKNQAGVRIRYLRIQAAMARLGCSLELINIQDFTSRATFVHDLYLVSKCYDARAVVAAHMLRSLGKPVGVDLFDDYFSQVADSRFVRLRHWLKALLALSSFVLCSTPAMRQVAHQYAPALPVHVMNDPATPTEIPALADALRRKVEFARENRCLDLAWFGMGDNPNFPVGLEDLVAFGGELAPLRGRGYQINFTILTNRRALTQDSLAALKRLPLAYRIEEWSEEKEQSLLASSLLCFLPVNGQSFSTVKSLNRAVTALSAGTQVLSVGYPLYEVFSDLIYRDARDFMADLSRGELRLREKTLPLLARRLGEYADIDRESAALATFLGSIHGPARPAPLKGGVAVIHGKETLGDIHKFTQRMGGLSVASPFTTANLHFDLCFTFSEGGAGFDVRISAKKSAALPAEARTLLRPDSGGVAGQYMLFESAKLYPDIQVRGAALTATDSPCTDAAAYPPVMQGVSQVLERLYPGVACIQAEQSKWLPWHVRGPAGEGLRQPRA